MITKNSPIGVFDSGVGGISVLRALRAKLPSESFVFFGDSLNAPYGEKSPDEIRALSEASLSFLMQHNAKAIVIACNTATSAAAEYLREKYPNQIIVGMEPAVKPAAKYALSNSGSRILLMATPATIEGQRLRHLLEKYCSCADFRLLPAPRLVRLLEAGNENSEEMRNYLSKILSPYAITDGNAPELPIDGLILGCTHFPFLKRQIKAALGYEPQFFDGAEGTARETAHRLRGKGLLLDTAEGDVKLYSSNNSTELMERLLNMPE